MLACKVPSVVGLLLFFNLSGHGDGGFFFNAEFEMKS